MVPTKDPPTRPLPLLLTPQGTRRAVAGATAMRIPGGMHVITSLEHREDAEIQFSKLPHLVVDETERLEAELELRQTEIERLEGELEEVHTASGRILLEEQRAKNDAIDLRVELKRAQATRKELETELAAANIRIGELSSQLANAE